MLHPYAVVMRAMWDKPPTPPGEFPDAEVEQRRRLRLPVLRLQRTEETGGRLRFARRRIRPIA